MLDAELEPELVGDPVLAPPGILAAQPLDQLKVDGKGTEIVTKALARKIRSLPTQLSRSLTWDRGTEMNRHANFTLATGMKVYFCDPHSPWQRGTNENTNRLLRQYFPKGEPLDVYSQRQLNAVARRLNGRPRKVLGFRTPADG